MSPRMQDCVRRDQLLYNSSISVNNVTIAALKDPFVLRGLQTIFKLSDATDGTYVKLYSHYHYTRNVTVYKPKIEYA